MATMGGLAGLALIGAVTLSALVATVLNTFAGGIVLGVGTVTVAWVMFNNGGRFQQHRSRIPGRSRTLDCRRRRWQPRVASGGYPHLPSPADRRVRPCRNSRHPGA
jgi:hypothetical protein